MKTKLFTLVLFALLAMLLAAQTTGLSGALAQAESGLGAADTAFNGITHTDANGNMTGMTQSEYTDLLTIQSYETGIRALQLKYQGR
jgi:hypothetical protein